MNLPLPRHPCQPRPPEIGLPWYEQQAEGLGVEMVCEVRDTLVRIGDQPEGYIEMRPGIRRAQVRQFSFGVFYRILKNRVEVIGIFHDRRSPSVWQRRSRGY